MPMPPKLSPAQVAEALTMLANKHTQREVAAYFGVARITITRMKRRLREDEELKVPRLSPCGTNAAYERHRLRKEPACRKCLLALAERKQKERDKKKSASSAGGRSGSSSSGARGSAQIFAARSTMVR